MMNIVDMLVKNNVTSKTYNGFYIKLSRWIAKDQEKVMESVRYLIKMRDENKAKREAREREEREKMGLPAIEDKVY